MSTKTPECWASDPQTKGLRIEVSPGRSLLLPHDQFIFAELTSGGDEQHLKLVFATLMNLKRLDRYATVAEALQAAARTKVVTVTPELVARGEGNVRGRASK